MVLASLFFVGGNVLGNTQEVLFVVRARGFKQIQKVIVRVSMIY